MNKHSTPQPQSVAQQNLTRDQKQAAAPNPVYWLVRLLIWGQRNC